MEMCVNCDVSTNETTVCYEDKHWCGTCAEVNLFMSDVDQEYYPRSMRVIFENNRMTEEQRDEIIDEQYSRCDHCSELIHNELDESYEVERYRGGRTIHETWCESCADDTTVCHQCGERCDDEQIIRSIGNDYCTPCHDDNIRMCDDCGEEMHRDDTYYDDDDTLCSGCSDNRSSNLIKGYFYNPTRFFHREDYEVKLGAFYQKNTAYLGIELEVDTPDDSAIDVARRCHLLHDEQYIYLKEDASINGFEIVTQPSTFEALKNDYKWKDILEQLQENGARGYDSGDCGIHVHITKQAYTPIVWWRAIKFLSKCETQVGRFSQRGDNTSYCKIKDVESYDNGCMWNFIKEYPRNSGTRYLAINFGDRQPTGEFRLYRSTTNKERFWASIEFSYGLMDFCNNHGYNFIRRNPSHVVWKEFMNHIKKLGYQTLYKHLVKRSIV